MFAIPNETHPSTPTTLVVRSAVLVPVPVNRGPKKNGADPVPGDGSSSKAFTTAYRMKNGCAMDAGGGLQNTVRCKERNSTKTRKTTRKGENRNTANKTRT